MVISTGPPSRLRMTAGPRPTLQLLRFCVSLISVSLFGRFSSLQVYGIVENLRLRGFGSHFVRLL